MSQNVNGTKVMHTVIPIIVDIRRLFRSLYFIMNMTQDVVSFIKLLYDMQKNTGTDFLRLLKILTVIIFRTLKVISLTCPSIQLMLYMSNQRQWEKYFPIVFKSIAVKILTQYLIVLAILLKNCVLPVLYPVVIAMCIQL